MIKSLRFFSIALLILSLASCSPMEEDVLLQENKASKKGEKEPITEASKDAIDPILEKIDIENDESISVLVNKHNKLGEDYVPKDLATITVPHVLENPEVNQLRKEAKEALSDMFAAAENEGLYLFARSGYRSYDTQVQLFNNYAEQHGEEAANTYSAKPGASEHQTGLVMDITSESVHFELTEEFGNTPEGKWVRKNAHYFGFIIRYPEGKEDVTGYIYEPWHLRYLGVDLATAIYESGLTYEEFLVEKGVLDHVSAKK